MTPDQFVRDIDKLGPLAKRAAYTALNEAKKEALREAIRNAPRGPTQAQLNKAQKERYVAKHGSAKGFNKHKALGMALRNPNSHSRPAPGGLEKSIKAQTVGAQNASEMQAVIYVAANAPAGKYAKRIHDDKGKSWHKRGLGTVAKGVRADELFIKRAVDKVAKGFKARMFAIFKRLNG
jgi:hypothetical protein